MLPSLHVQYTWEVKELPCKKTRRSLLLGAELNTQVQEEDVRRQGLAVNTEVVINWQC